MRRLLTPLWLLIPATAAARDANSAFLEGVPASPSGPIALQAAEPSAGGFDPAPPRTLRRADTIGPENAPAGEPQSEELGGADDFSERDFVGKPWQLDRSVYFLLAGMSGDIDAYGYSADVDMSFRNLVDHLEFGAMGSARFAYQRFALAVDVFYLFVSGDGLNATVDASQWLVEPSLGFKIIDEIELLGGVRYNNLHLELRGNYPIVPTADFNFWDPFLGARGTVPLSRSLSINLRADIGGFGIGSRVSWQVFPYVSWSLAGWLSAEGGYRVFQTQYHTGSGVTALDYDVITYGPQLGLSVHF
jgi:hypothetical protein